LPVAVTIETRKQRAGSLANREVTMMYWEIGRYIGSILYVSGHSRYSKQNIAALSQELVNRYGKSFEHTKIVKMIKFAELFPEPDIVATLSEHLSWSHFIELLPVKDKEARLYYAKDAAARQLGVRELRKEISRKDYETRETADLPREIPAAPFNAFKDPYLIATLGYMDEISEADLEKAILEELVLLILELGQGLALVERTKQMSVGDDVRTLDLLFYHRIVKKLVAVELEVGEFDPKHEERMGFFLKWLKEHERKEGENDPVGLIVYTKDGVGQFKLMELSNSGVETRDHLPDLPTTKDFEEKLKALFFKAQEAWETSRGKKAKEQ
jgi:predicted nuclease of restriction endonuclease-like (RecB) superfamily